MNNVPYTIMQGIYTNLQYLLNSKISYWLWIYFLESLETAAAKPPKHNTRLSGTVALLQGYERNRTKRSRVSRIAQVH